MKTVTTDSRLIRAGCPFLAALILWSGTAGGQELLYHLPLDGSLENRGSIGATPAMYVKEGEDAPQIVPGRIDRALHFDSEATVALPFVLDHDDYPQVTITAWVKQDLATSGTRAVLSSGSDAGARLGVNGGRLAVKAGRSSVTFDEDMPRGEWVFVAGVIDVANGWARLHQNDAVYLREAIDTSAKAPREFKDPNDPDGGKRPYLFVGAHQFRSWQQTKRGLSIDDVRLYGGALSVAQVNAVRGGSSAAVPDSAPNQPRAAHEIMPPPARRTPVSGSRAGRQLPGDESEER